MDEIKPEFLPAAGMWIVLNYLSREYTEFGCNEIGRNTIYMQELGKRKKERKKERKRERERKKEREKERERDDMATVCATFAQFSLLP